MSAVPHLHTLTGNLLAERTLEFIDWTPGKTQRATRETFQVGGKGINVSKMLNRLGTPNTALAFAGGATGAESVEWLRARNFSHQIFSTTAATRIGVVVRGGAHEETTFLGPDTPPDAAAVRACAAHLDALPAGDVLALGGSFPGWASADFEPLRSALTRWLARSPLVADTYGPPLAWLASQPLALVKINRVEFDGLFSAAERTSPVPDRLRTARSRWPVQRWIISDGAKSVWLLDATGEPVELIPPCIQEVSATGSGDVLFACVLHGLYARGLGLRDAAVFALPYAAANAAHPGVAEFPEPIL